MPRKIDLTVAQATGLIQRFLPGRAVVRLLGAGSFGQVFLVEDEVSRAAVKIVPLKMRGATEPEENHEWRQLTTQWDRLHHASLVRIRSFHEYTDPDPVAPIEIYGLIHMDYWPIDLYDFIKRLKKYNLYNSVRKRRLLNRLAQLLHRLLADVGLIITDLKLENILVSSRDPGVMELGVIDTGGICEARLADYYRVITTDFFKPPELLDHRVTRIDEGVVQFGFGLVGYYILEGRWPVADYDYQQPIWAKIAQQKTLHWSDEILRTMPGCVAVIERCLNEDPASRHADLASIVAALRAEETAWEEGLNREGRGRVRAVGPPAAPERGKERINRVWREPVTGQEFVWIPGGGFDMGQSPEEEALLRRFNDPETFEKWFGGELPRHRVQLDGFWMGRFPVTRGAFRVFVEETLHVTDVERAQFILRYNQRAHQGMNWHHWKNTRYHQDDTHPVIHVSWFDAVAFADWLSRRTGLRFALPSEAQWEYACHGGGQTPFHFGAGIDSSLANYDGTEPYGDGPAGVRRKGTMPCGTFPANRYGLCDMHGTVWEWCEDLFDNRFYATPAARQRNPLHRGEIGYRIKRGGSWRVTAALVRASHRGGAYPDVGKDDLGFRLILSPWVAGGMAGDGEGR
ncbi:Hercynine oxygenase [Candidatus Magnetaquicoccaceae bacterium FCR-1]|uniref:Hercynine oxygenase n=1 Tax=Candidatus Magnetaquiglobus chichijimensis TaxID=3141448 RepID=A0ABQ0C7L8_9PROT